MAILATKINKNLQQTFAFVNSWKLIEMVENSGDVNSRDVNSRDVNSRDVNPRDVNPRDVNPRDVNSRDVNPRDVNPGDVNPGDVNSNNFPLSQMMSKNTFQIHRKFVQII